MRFKIKAVEEAVAQDKCRHYWLIETPKGPISRGVCKLCGVEKDFYNSVRYLLGDIRNAKPGGGG